MHRQPPFVLGYDVVGEIDQLGDGVRGFQLGDRVADMTVVGSNAAYRTLRASDLTRVPAGVDAAEAATLILSWTTAYQLLHRAARVHGGERVLVHGAAGAVGQALLTLGRMAGLKLWGTARGDHAALVRELGATPIDYQHEDFTRVLPGGFDVDFDGIGEDGCRRRAMARSQILENHIAPAVATLEGLMLQDASKRQSQRAAALDERPEDRVGKDFVGVTIAATGRACPGESSCARAEGVTDIGVHLNCTGTYQVETIWNRREHGI
jgi:Zn-dependent alcohol dehydrogenase